MSLLHRRLKAASEALSALHRRLLEAARLEYERTHGPVGGPYAFWALLTKDPAFAWLRPMTRLMVQLDDLLSRKGPPPARALLLRMAVRMERLILPKGEREFAANLAALLREDALLAARRADLRRALERIDRDRLRPASSKPSRAPSRPPRPPPAASGP